MFKRLVFLFVITSLLSGSLWSQSTANTHIVADWVLAGSIFTLQSSPFQNVSSVQGITSTLPTLILENLTDTGVRILAPEEILERQLVVLNKERTTLGNSLTSAIQERDKQLFSSSSEKDLKKKLKEKDKKILEIRQQLAEKEAYIREIKEQLEKKDFQEIQDERESVVLWQNSARTLFTKDRVKNEDINGLLTGKITASGNYLAVTVQLTLYPGAIHSIEIHSLSSVADLTLMAQEIASQLKPVLQNRTTVEVLFQIEPAQAAEKAKIFVDGQAFTAKNYIDKELLLAAGSHTVEVESPGFYSRTFDADFSHKNRFLATVNLDPVQQVPVRIESEKFPDSPIYIDSLPEGTTGKDVELNTGMAFGTLFPPEEEAAPYYFVADITPESKLSLLNVRLKRDTQEISTRIEKRRRAMYNSYSALLVSLIPSFVSYGMYVNMSNGWALGHEQEEQVQLWKNISTGSMILSAGLGINLAVQLGLFIGAADSVLPEQAKVK